MPRSNQNTLVTCLSNKKIDWKYCKKVRCRQDLNLRGETPLDFKSNALTTRPQQLENRRYLLFYKVLQQLSGHFRTRVRADYPQKVKFRSSLQLVENWKKNTTRKFMFLWLIFGQNGFCRNWMWHRLLTSNHIKLALQSSRNLRIIYFLFEGIGLSVLQKQVSRINDAKSVIL